VIARNALAGPLPRPDGDPLRCSTNLRPPRLRPATIVFKAEDADFGWATAAPFEVALIGELNTINGSIATLQVQRPRLIALAQLALNPDVVRRPYRLSPFRASPSMSLLPLPTTIFAVSCFRPSNYQRSGRNLTRSQASHSVAVRLAKRSHSKQ
jgi:hypothetical protein